MIYFLFQAVLYDSIPSHMHVYEMVIMCAHVSVSLDPATDRRQNFYWIEFGII